MYGMRTPGLAALVALSLAKVRAPNASSGGYLPKSKKTFKRNARKAKKGKYK